MNFLQRIARIFSPVVTSLKNKIILLTCGAVLLSTLLVAGVDYFRVEKIVFDTSIEKLAGETRLMAQRFKVSYDQMKSDVQVLSQTPPIQGIVRSQAANNIDPLDGSTTSIWRQRLATIFTSMMAARHHYSQIRYIGIADKGRELVRVNRTTTGSQTVAEQDLQGKLQEPYFQAGLQTAKNGVHFSEVTYNREFNALDSALVPTVRAVLPIFEQDQNMFGMIVINASYGEMLRSALQEIAPRYNTFVVNASGDYMEYAKDGKIGRLEFHDNYTSTPPDFVNKIVGTHSQEEVYTADGVVSYFVRLNIDPNNPEAFLGVVVSVPYEELLVSATQARTLSIILGAILVLVCLLASLVIARKFVEPLEKMTNQIKSTRGNKTLENLPLLRQDEIGELARAFDRKTRELATNEAKLVAIVDNTIDGLITFDKLGTIETFNYACEKIFGYQAAEVIGKSVKMLVPEIYFEEQGTRPKSSNQIGLHKLIGQETEVTGQTKNADTFPLDLSISEVNIGDRKIYSGITRDISERKQMDIMKDEFISTVNHELRTPLTSIQGSLGLLMATMGKDVDEKSKKLLQLSYDNCQRLSRLVNDILDIERIAAGKMDYQLKDVEICQLVRDIVGQQVSYAEKFGVEFVMHFGQPEIHVNLDQDRFNQALVNLISNATKFSKAGDKVEIAVALNEASAATISVRDFGPGIPESFHPKVFSKFAQADGSATRAQEGTGLGLNITKKIIEAFGGTVDFQTEVGLGSTFTFTLPTSEPEKMRA